MKEETQANPAPDNFFYKKEGLSLVPTKASFFRPNDYPVPRLKLLDDMVETIQESGHLPDLSNTYFIGVQHMLETTVTLFDALIKLGVKPENMYFSGKCYSSAPEIEREVRKRGIYLMPSNKPRRPGEYQEYSQEGIQKMWAFFAEDIKNKRVDRIIVLDEGGRCLENMPNYIKIKYRVAAIEQTRAGLYSESINLLPFPLIEVASCAVKKILEPPLIATAITRRLEIFLQKLAPDKDSTIFGVVGNGAIGNAICRHLLLSGYTVAVYDEEKSAFQHIVNKNFYRLHSVEEVIADADIIFGCTGKDILKNIDVLGIVKQDKIFVSCTSEDKEFLSLLKIVANQNLIPVDPLSDIVCLTNNGRRILIVGGGYPFNFDKTPWNVPAESIEVTQGLLLGGCIQAILVATQPVGDGVTVNQGSHQSLDSYIQQYVAQHWLPRQPKGSYPDSYMMLFNNVMWIQKNSGGKCYENEFIIQCFANTSANNEKLNFETPKSKL